MRQDYADLRIPDNRRTYPWGREDQDLLAFHREMIRIRKEHPVLRYGSTRFLTMEEQFISYGRFDGRETILVLMNNAQEERKVEIPVWDGRSAGRGETGMPDGNQ